MYRKTEKNAEIVQLRQEIDKEERILNILYTLLRGKRD